MFIALFDDDLFPYITGYEVIQLFDDGRVTLKDFGVDIRFKPDKLLPFESGKELLAKLTALGIEYDIALSSLEALFIKRRDDLIK